MREERGRERTELAPYHGQRINDQQFHPGERAPNAPQSAILPRPRGGASDDGRSFSEAIALDDRDAHIFKELENLWE
jgi:hypothetical protein